MMTIQNRGTFGVAVKEQAQKKQLGRGLSALLGDMKPDAAPVIAKDPTSAIPRPSSAVRSNRSRLGRAGGSGVCAHCSDSASRRFVIQPMPE